MPELLEIAPCVRKSLPSPAPAQARKRRRLRLRFSSVRRLAALGAYSGLLYAFVSSGMHPYVEAHRLSQQADEIQQQIAREQQRHDLLARKVAILQTPAGEQAAARTYGWVLPGEVPIACSLPDTELSRASDAAICAIPTPPRPGLIQRLERAVEW